MRSANDRVLRPLWPNAGIEAEYRRRIRDLVDELHDSVLYWIRAAYRASEPVVATIAEDELPAAALRATLRKLTRRWRKNFDATAEKLARWFARSVSSRSDKALKKMLADGGFAVEFRLTRAQRDVLRATVEANVSLICSIPQRYLHEVEGIVMRGVQRGGDLESVARAIEKQHGLTRRRAALIARDQNSKATAALTRARRLEIGLPEAVWMHSHAGRTPRPTHVKMHGKKFRISEGMWDPAVGRMIQPGEEINCRCTSRPVVPGFS